MASNLFSLRQRMVNEDLIPFGIIDPLVIQALKNVPRELFVDANLRAQAYDNFPLDIGESQTISQPYTVAFMTQLLEIKPDDRVLEIGTGSGYQSAVLAEIVGAENVISIEMRDNLAEQARSNLAEAGYPEVQVLVGDGSQGFAPEAPYDTVIVTAGAPEIPTPLIEQLAKGGKIVIPVGDDVYQTMTRGIKDSDGLLSIEDCGDFMFVPLIGKYGW